MGGGLKNIGRMREKRAIILVGGRGRELKGLGCPPQKRMVASKGGIGHFLSRRKGELV